jgi:hypothetical protein
VQIRIVSGGGTNPLFPAYVAWRDRYYGPRADHDVPGVEIRVFERR